VRKVGGVYRQLTAHASTVPVTAAIPTQRRGVHGHGVFSSALLRPWAIHVFSIATLPHALAISRAPIAPRSWPRRSNCSPSLAERLSGGASPCKTPKVPRDANPSSLRPITSRSQVSLVANTAPKSRIRPAPRSISSRCSAIPNTRCFGAANRSTASRSRARSRARPQAAGPRCAPCLTRTFCH